MFHQQLPSIFPMHENTMARLRENAQAAVIDMIAVQMADQDGIDGRLVAALGQNCAQRLLARRARVNHQPRPLAPEHQHIAAAAAEHRLQTKSHGHPLFRPFIDSDFAKQYSPRQSSRKIIFDRTVCCNGCLNIAELACAPALFGGGL
jgi:hypothetical protein